MCIECVCRTEQESLKYTSGTSDTSLVVKHLSEVFHSISWCRTGEIFTDVRCCFASFNSSHTTQNGKFLEQKLVWLQWIMEQKYFVGQVEGMDALKQRLHIR